MIKKVKIAEVKPNPNNPRLIKDDKFRKLVKSIQEFPDMLNVRPIVVNQDMVVLGGNMRLKAIKEAGYKDIAVQIVDWSEDQQKEFIVKDNASFGEWNWDDLANNWDEEQLVEWGVYAWVNKGNDDLLELDAKTEEETSNAPKITDEGYSLFEIVMLHENKVHLFDVLNQVKREFLFDKTEDALMEIIRIYENKN
jgi:Ni,Fe-hydrogenase I large subunit